jgi:hypothetical protein
MDRECLMPEPPEAPAVPKGPTVYLGSNYYVHKKGKLLVLIHDDGQAQTELELTEDVMSALWRFAVMNK